MNIKLDCASVHIVFPLVQTVKSQHLSTRWDGDLDCDFPSLLLKEHNRPLTRLLYLDLMDLALETIWSDCICCSFFVRIEHKRFVTTPEQTSPYCCITARINRRPLLSLHFPQFVIAGCSPLFFLPPVCIFFFSPVWQSHRCTVQLASTWGWEAVPFDSWWRPLPSSTRVCSTQQVRLQTSGGGCDCHRRMTASWPARFFEADASRSALRLLRHAWSLP